MEKEIKRSRMRSHLPAKKEEIKQEQTKFCGEEFQKVFKDWQSFKGLVKKHLIHQF